MEKNHTFQRQSTLTKHYWSHLYMLKKESPS